MRKHPDLAELLRVMRALADRYQVVYEEHGAVVMKELGSIGFERS